MSLSKLSEGDTPSLDVSLSAGNTSNPPSVESLSLSGGQSQTYENKPEKGSVSGLPHMYKHQVFLKECIARKNSLSQGICGT